MNCLKNDVSLLKQASESLAATSESVSLTRTLLGAGDEDTLVQLRKLAKNSQH